MWQQDTSENKYTAWVYLSVKTAAYRCVMIPYTISYYTIKYLICDWRDKSYTLETVTEINRITSRGNTLSIPQLAVSIPTCLKQNVWYPVRATKKHNIYICLCYKWFNDNTKQEANGISPPNIAKSRNRKIWVYRDPIDLTFINCPVKNRVASKDKSINYVCTPSSYV